MAGTPSVLGNVTFLQGACYLFYAVTPKETSFAQVGDVPDYVNQVVPFFFGAIMLEYILAFLTNLPRTEAFVRDRRRALGMSALESLYNGKLPPRYKLLAKCMKVLTAWNVSELMGYHAVLIAGVMHCLTVMFGVLVDAGNIFCVVHNSPLVLGQANALNIKRIRLIISSFTLALYAFVHNNFCLVNLPWDNPWTWYLCFIGVDFLYYWFHRAAHEINILWAAHQVNHSSRDYNLTTALRQSVVQKYTSAFFYVPLALAVPPSIFFVHTQFNLLYQFWIHTEIVRSIGPLEYILNTPSHHRVHHGRNPYCIDKNYGGTLIIWDRMFGTFQAETDEEIAYGLVHPLASWDPIYTQLCHFSYIWKTVWETPGLTNKLSSIFKGPGWTPGKPRLGDPADLPEIEYPIQKYDSSVTHSWANLYLVHFVLTLVAYQILIARRMVLSQLHVIGVILYFILTISSAGALFDNKWYAPYMELFRCLLFLIIDLILSSQNVDTGVFPTNFIGVIRGIFMVSAFVWITGALLSSKRSKTE